MKQPQRLLAVPGRRHRESRRRRERFQDIDNRRVVVGNQHRNHLIRLLVFAMIIEKYGKNMSGVFSIILQTDKNYPYYITAH